MKKNIIKAIRAYLKEKYGAINGEWELTLNLLEDNINLYNKCMDEINTYGIYDPSTGHKNPLLSTTKDIQATIIKQIQHLGLTPYAASKIRTEDEDLTEDFIESLISDGVK